MNELNSIKTIKEIANLQGKAIDDKEVKAVYEKVANTYIDTILNKEADRIIIDPKTGHKVMAHTKEDADAWRAFTDKQTKALGITPKKGLK